MSNRIVRDVDIRHNEAQGNQEIVRDAVTGKQLTNVTVVDANTANVPNADGSQGTINTNASVVTNPNQSLIGGGLQVTGASGATATFETRPTFMNSNNAVDAPVVANGASVRGINTNGGRNGIATTYNGSDDPTAASQVLNNIVNGASVDGIRTGNINGTVADNTATGCGVNGFVFSDVSGTFSNNTSNVSEPLV